MPILTSASPRDEQIEHILAPYLTCTLPEGEGRDAFFMDAALLLARFAAASGEVPVGCVIARGGTLLAGECNARESLKNPLWHAETAAIERAAAILGGWRLAECTLYVTLEPCPMCAGAIWNARVPRVVIGTKDPRAGAMGSILNLNSYPLNFRPALTFGVRERDCAEVLRAFFAERRLHERREKSE